MMRRALLRLFSSSLLPITLCATAAARQGPTPLTAVEVAQDVLRPLWAGSPPGDAARLFVVEQWTGLVRILKDGAFLPNPFLDLSGRISLGADQGMRAMAFHPDYQKTGLLFVTYIDLAGD